MPPYSLPRRGAVITTLSRGRAWAAHVPAEPVPFDRRELHRELTCPRCGGRFDTYPHLGPGSVVIDNCIRCDLIWLDFGEMKQMVDAPGRDRGSRQVPRVDSRYVRGGGVERAPSAIDDPLTFLVSMLRKD